MSYSTDHLRTAGKITVYTTFLGLVAFAVIFIFNLGETQIKQADAQSSATTTVTVLNIPPYWVASTTEETESSATNPTNEGDEIAWIATAGDYNFEDYYLLICESSATPTPGTSGAQPSCSTGTQWAVSTATVSGTQARAATTTLASTSPFAGEVFTWYAWICDNNSSNPTSARCNLTPTQGTNATNSSPFEVNHRPLFTAYWNDGPADPGQTVTFTSTSSDTDISGVADTVRLFVCATAGFDTVNDTCTGNELASTTVGVASNATASYTVVIPTQDNVYGAYGYVIDNHGLESGNVLQGSTSPFTVNNVAPTVSSSTISLAQAAATNTDIYLTVEAGQTTGFTLSFTTSDNNSCDAVGGGLGDEITNYELSIYRNGTGPVTSSSTTCPVTGSLNPNNCYPSAVPTATWNLVCTASTTSCTGSGDVDMEWDCTFPLWYVADPTDGTATSTQYSTNDWRAQVRAIDDNFATGTLAESSSGVEVISFLAFALNTLSIPYGSLEPGQQTDPLVATTTIAATGNVGLDKDVIGTSMCEGYTTASPCAPSSTSTIPAQEQRFSTTTSQSYASSTALSSTTPQEVEINVPKSTATSSQATADAYWGIRVPGTISYAGDYTGENTFTAIVGESSDW